MSPAHYVKAARRGGARAIPAAEAGLVQFLECLPRSGAAGGSGGSASVLRSLRTDPRGCVGSHPPQGAGPSPAPWPALAERRVRGDPVLTGRVDPRCSRVLICPPSPSESEEGASLGSRTGRDREKWKPTDTGADGHAEARQRSRSDEAPGERRSVLTTASEVIKGNRKGLSQPHRGPRRKPR